MDKRKINLIDLSVLEIEKIMIDLREEKYRGRQVFRWINKGIQSIDDMTDIKKELREKLKEISDIKKCKIIKKQVSDIDLTYKYLLKLSDGNTIECVLMKYKHGYSLCISSQVGCKMGCKFCASTGIAYLRNLTPGEMLDQVLTIQGNLGERIGHLVLMGIGEPLDNYDNVISFLKLVNHKDGLNIGFRHISVSTCGIIPKILSLSNENIQITLSISLHAPNDIIREKIMPITKVYSIDKIIEACKIYTERTKRRITFEYAMIEGVNTLKDHAYELAKRIKGILCHVNLIPINVVEGVGFVKPTKKTMETFKNILISFGIETTLRRELGSNIDAACGQLRAEFKG